MPLIRQDYNILDGSEGTYAVYFIYTEGNGDYYTITTYNKENTIPVSCVPRFYYSSTGVKCSDDNITITFIDGNNLTWSYTTKKPCRMVKEDGTELSIPANTTANFNPLPYNKVTTFIFE